MATTTNADAQNAADVKMKTEGPLTLRQGHAGKGNAKSSTRIRFVSRVVLVSKSVVSVIPTGISRLEATTTVALGLGVLRSKIGLKGRSRRRD